MRTPRRAQGLYDPANEHDACGVGFLAHARGEKSHTLIRRAILVLENLKHRGAAGADNKTGDGAGLLCQIPDAFLREQCARQKLRLPDEGWYGVGMVFLPSAKKSAATAAALIQETVARENLAFLGWRDVPVEPDALGAIARVDLPWIRQFFVGASPNEIGDAFERRLYLARKQIQAAVARHGGLDACYVVSLSSRTVCYKGLMMGSQMNEFFRDLTDESFVSGIAVVHQRYSTNTFPSWPLAQPFRFLAHNGEINTLRANINQMAAREKSLHSPLLGREMKKALPIIEPGGSDSACLDNVLELLTLTGRDLPHAMMMLVPQAWGRKYFLGPDLKGFYEYHAGLMEPWDGPAAVAFTNGIQVGALLDRNGLRPIRYTMTTDGFIVLASETGVLDFQPEEIAEKGALRPGQMILVDTHQQRVFNDGEIKALYARRQPYRRWVEENKVVLHGLFSDIAPVHPDEPNLLRRQKRFGYSREDLSLILNPMASKGEEPVGSMGNDAPLAVLSEKPQLLYWYFKQLFAQVTNPPIDSIREELVMSLMTFVGNPGNILTETPAHARLIKLPHPFLSNDDVARLRDLRVKDFSSATLPMAFPAGGSPAEFESALNALCEAAVAAVRKHKAILILTDKDLPESQAPLPALLAVSAVNRRLIEEGVRTGTGLVVETGEAREVHHMALLLGYGATAINPYLAFESVAAMAAAGSLDAPVDGVKAVENYVHALNKGLLKIMSKMGISTLRSYRGGQVFEAVGLKKSLVDRYFTGTASRIEGIGLEEICAESNARHTEATAPNPDQQSLLSSGGVYRWRKDGERHLWTPEAISRLQWATRKNDIGLYREYARMINDQTRRQCTLRGLFRFKKTTPIPLDEVEPIEAIIKRFVTSAMSFGSISREAHETLAIAMNRLGAASNSGEGGEDRARFKPLPYGDNRCSAIKQVASARFGVTVEYLVSARELQIKIAQGAKPGEGGQIPGYKVNEEIARVRNATPGVTLISPPPHHDIYSIEDLKQLIFDLKNANPEARISVKLVSEVGVGTVAAGVAKAYADMVLISGYDGGTGASPLSSIKHAGVPWELGLAETHQTLVLNKLRTRIRVQTDGQMKTGRDVVIAAMLGAEEYGFGTTPLVVCGCIMMRQCHLNTCPVGVATQRPELRERFTGDPAHVVNFFRMVATEVREYLAQLGVRTMDELVGRSDLLEMNDAIEFWKARGLDYTNILMKVGEPGEPVRCIEVQDHGLSDVMDRELIRLAAPAIERGEPVTLRRKIRNTDRTTGSMLSGAICRRYGIDGLPDDTIVCEFEGSAGQSFGAFLAHGITLKLTGESNDYLGKGLSGGRIVVMPPQGIRYDPSKNFICGNVLLYGATSGEAYILGRAGERFCVRNSGAFAVVEGVGDHGCEYMTGGRVVILGETGLNFAAGMSGGIAYVLDEDYLFDSRCNLDMVDLEPLDRKADVAEVRGMIERHVRYTGSPKGRAILNNWERYQPHFVKVFPMEYKLALGRMSKEDQKTERDVKLPQ